MKLQEFTNFEDVKYFGMYEDVKYFGMDGMYIYNCKPFR